MAPHQEECWDNNDSSELFVTNVADPATLLNDSALKSTVFVSSSPAASSLSAITRPVGILRQPTYLAANITEQSTVMPSHWPLTPSLSSDDELDNKSIHFPDDLIASIHHRPRTHILDIPQLFYSATDIKKFKREYRNLVRVQSLARKRMEHNSNETIHRPAQQQPCEVTTKPEHDNSLWRSKVHRRWSAPSSSQVDTAVSMDDSWDPLNDGSISLSSSSSSLNDEVQREEPASHYEDIFSSIFDVARDTLLVLNGSTKYNSLP